jgi:hypothetical protein
MAGKPRALYCHTHLEGLAARSAASDDIDWTPATPEEVAQTVRLEVWCTRTAEAGEQYCLLRLFRKDEEQPFVERRI